MANIEKPDLEIKVNIIDIPDGESSVNFVNAEWMNAVREKIYEMIDKWNAFPSGDDLTNITEKISELIKTNKEIQDLLRGPAGDVRQSKIDFKKYAQDTDSEEMSVEDAFYTSSGQPGVNQAIKDSLNSNSEITYTTDQGNTYTRYVLKKKGL